MKEYVVGFCFNADLDEVLLIEKNRPEWQAGKLNGIGGHIEVNEAPIAAMVREFREETGCLSALDSWLLVCPLEFAHARVFFYVMAPPYHSYLYRKAKTTTDERLRRVDVESMNEEEDMINNLKFLIPLSIQRIDDFYNRQPRDI